MSAVTTAMELKKNCPDCGKPQQTDGQITWCENAHVYRERKTMLIYARPRRPGKCRSCKREVDWVLTRNSKWHPMDRGFEVIGREGVAGGILGVYCDQSHFSTCPNAKKHRKGGGR